MSGVGKIAAERKRQIDAEGWTPEHDDEHTDGALARAAACYAQIATELKDLHPDYFRIVPYWLQDTWPANWEWKPSKDPIRNLVKAGALIAAEIDRLEHLS